MACQVTRSFANRACLRRAGKATAAVPRYRRINCADAKTMAGSSTGGHKVNEIRNLSDVSSWEHGPSEKNLADILSRGCSAQQLIYLRWWEGPSWLSENPVQCPRSKQVPDEEAIDLELRKSVLVNTTKIIEEFNWHYKYFSSYLKVVRIIAWIFRFFKNAKRIDVCNTSEVTFSEFDHAEKTVIKLIQMEKFEGVTDEKSRPLKPFLDEFGILRAGTKLSFREDTDNFKFPIILPNEHPVVHLMIVRKHEEFMHAGVSIVMDHLRENFWILKARKLIRQIIQKCTRCKRFSAQKTEVVPSSLPKDRVSNSKIFQVVGVDLAGPLHLRDKRYRVVEDKATDYAHLKQALSEQFPVVRNRSELETRFYSSPQKHNQNPSDFVYDLLKIHKILKLEMTEEKLIDHIISRKIRGSSWESRDIKPSENNRFPNRNRQENWRETRDNNRYLDNSRPRREFNRFESQGVADNRRFNGRRRGGQSDHGFHKQGGRQGGSRNSSFRDTEHRTIRISSLRMTPVDLPYVPILLNETFITALWDTGAEKSFISEEVYRKYFSYRPRQKTKDRVVTAQGAPCCHLGRVELQIRTREFQKTWEFHILNNMQYQCILGIDFMKESKLTLDFDQKSLIIPDNQIKQLPKVEKPVEIDLPDTKLGEGQ
ncbi:integrase catalytic domain-containing protein [Trichonephila clavipes]|nr:integrase catalytic domain-containing protein [Trichonephila clavipes]